MKMHLFAGAVILLSLALAGVAASQPAPEGAPATSEQGAASEPKADSVPGGAAQPTQPTEPTQPTQPTGPTGADVGSGEVAPSSGTAATETKPVKPAGSAVTQPTLSESDYTARLRNMEEKVAGLKESVYATKTRLALLKERILANVVSEAWIVIVHKNDMGASFSLDEVSYKLDGGAQSFFQENKNGFLDKHRTLQIHSGALSTGNHSLAVNMKYRGSSGVFTYIEGYQFDIKAVHDFSAVQGKILYLEVVGYEKGGFTTSMEERPAIKFNIKEHPFNRDTLNRLTGQKGEGK